MIKDLIKKLHSIATTSWLENKDIVQSAANVIQSQKERIEQLEAELKAIDKTLDDPRANLTMTVVEVIQELKTGLAETNMLYYSAQNEIQKLKAQTEEPICKQCNGQGIVPIGDGYSVDPCPSCAAPPPSAEDAALVEARNSLAKRLATEDAKAYFDKWREDNWMYVENVVEAARVIWNAAIDAAHGDV